MNGIEAMWATSTVQAIAWALVHFLWQGALIGLAAAGALALLKKATVRYSVATAALVALLLCPVATAAFRMSETVEEPATIAEAAPAVPTISVGTPLALASAVPAAPAPLRELLPAAMPWLFGFWLAGVALLSVYHLGGWRQTQKWKRRETHPMPEEWQARLRMLARRLGIRREVGLLESAVAQVPAVVGWLRPVILVPASALAGLTPQQLEAILAHELAHVRRHDALVNLLQTLVETLLFYHPAVWWVSSQIRRERENCCDDLAVAVCGDRLVYARALADLEGLRVSAPCFVLAADGGSLVDRIRRLVGAPARREPRRRSWLAGALALSLLPFGAGFQFSSDPSLAGASVGAGGGGSAAEEKAEKKQERREKKRTEWNERGTWSIERGSGGKIQLQMQMRSVDGKSRWTSSNTMEASQLRGLGSGPDVRFQLPRDAGVFQFEGRFQGSEGTGFFTFQPNPSFAREMDRLGYQVGEDRLLEMALHDVSLAFAREMKAIGYDQVTTDKLVEFRIHGVTSDFVREMGSLGYENLPADKVIELKIHGVSPELVRALESAGYRGLSADKVVELKIHGVTPAFITELDRAGYRNLPADRLVEMRIHGVTPQYVRELAEAGYPNLAPKRLVEFRIHGVTADFIRDAERKGYKDLTEEELVDLKITGRLNRRR